MLFPWYTKYPYQNDEVLNLDWILKTIDSLVKEVSEFVTLNTIKYADPIQWNITTQYEKNTVVIDPISGSAYISTKPVPAGVGLNNTDYWNIIFTLDVISANKNLTLRDDANNMFATFESAVDDWLLWQGTLYVVTRDIQIGQAYVVDYNIDRATVEYFIKTYINNLKSYVDNLVGSLSSLSTTDKTSIVNAINEVIGNIGNLVNLNTTDKSSTVGAINEVNSHVQTVDSHVGDISQLNTTDKSSTVGAINEVNSHVQTVDSHVGDISLLNTTDKSSTVGAINELDEELNNLITYPRTLSGKTIALYGDSWSDPGQVHYIPWVNKLSQIAGTTVHNVSDSGRTMSQIAAAFDNFDADVYIIQGSVNDWNQNVTPTTFFNAINSIVSNIKVINPDAEIIFITAPAWLTHSPYYSSITSYYPMELYRQIIWQQAEEMGYMVASGLNMPLLKKGDGLHPSYDSVETLADYVNIAYLKNGDTRDFCNEFVATQNTSGFIIASGGTFYWRFVKDLTFDSNGEATFNDTLINSNTCLIIEPGVCSFSRLAGYGFIVYPELNSSGLKITAFQMATGQKATGTINNVCIHIPLTINYTTKMGVAN